MISNSLICMQSIYLKQIFFFNQWDHEWENLKHPYSLAQFPTLMNLTMREAVSPAAFLEFLFSGFTYTGNFLTCFIWTGLGVRVDFILRLYLLRVSDPPFYSSSVCSEAQPRELSRYKCELRNLTSWDVILSCGGLTLHTSLQCSAFTHPGEIIQSC